MGPRGGGGGDCKGCGVEIADRELGSGVGHGEMQKRAERESCHICTEEPPNQSAEKISLAEPPSTATNPWQGNKVGEGFQEEREGSPLQAYFPPLARARLIVHWG